MLQDILIDGTDGSRSGTTLSHKHYQASTRRAHQGRIGDRMTGQARLTPGIFFWSPRDYVCRWQCCLRDLQSIRTGSELGV